MPSQTAPNALTDRMAFRYSRETVYGITDAVAMQTLLITSEDFTSAFPTVESESVTGERQVVDVVRVGSDGAGSANFELMYGNLDDLLEGAMCAEWDTSDSIENGNFLISFSIEKHFQDITQFQAFKGCRVGTMVLNFVPRQRITGSMALMGRGGVFNTVTIGTGSPTSATTNPMMVTTDALSLEEASAAITAATSFTINLDNGLRPQNVLGNSSIRDIGIGTFRVTGQMECYFQNRTYIDKLLAETPSDYVIVTEDSEGNSYSWILPYFKFTGLAGPNNTGRSQDVMQALEWTALFDPSSSKTMRIER